MIDKPAPEPASAGLRVLVALCTVSFLGTLNDFMLAPFYVEVARDLDTTVPVLGQVVTAAILASGLLALIIGPLADHYGYRRVLLTGVLGLVVSAIGAALAPSFPVLLVSRLIGGVSQGALNMVALAAAGTLFHGPARRRAMSWAVASVAAPTIVGVPAVAALGDRVGWRWPFAIVAAVAIAGFILVRACLPRDASLTERPRFQPGSIVSVYRTLLRHRPTVSLFAVATLRAMTWVGMLTYLGAFWVDVKGLSVGGAGLVLGIGGSGYICGSIAAGGRLGRFDLRLLVAGMTATMALFFGLLYILPFGVVVLATMMFIAGAAGAIGWVALTTLLVGGTPAAVATTMALNSALFNLGGSLGSLGGGVLLAAGGYGALGVGLPIFALASAALIWQPRREQNPTLAVGTSE